MADAALGQWDRDSTAIIVVIGGDKGGKNGYEYEEVFVWGNYCNSGFEFVFFS